MQKHWFHLASLLILLSLTAHAVDDLVPLSFTVDGVERTALVYVPAAAKTSPVPLVFVFHGHGGTARQVAYSFAMDKYWPEAISVYMQGLPTPGQLIDPEGKLSGWQKSEGDQGDRDLKFFDAVLARMERDYQVDGKRIYATGHSNGGGFTYLLWLARGDVFAAVAPSSAVAKYVRQLKPKPVMHLAGQNDRFERVGQFITVPGNELDRIGQAVRDVQIICEKILDGGQRRIISNSRKLPQRAALELGAFLEPPSCDRKQSHADEDGGDSEPNFAMSGYIKHVVILARRFCRS